MAKRKHGKKSPSLNDKNNNKTTSYVFEDELSEQSRAKEAEFLKEEFANEYAEREHLIAEETSAESTLKSTDAPEVDLTADVNVDLALELEKSDSDVELIEVDSIKLEDTDTFTLNLGADDALPTEAATNSQELEISEIAPAPTPEEKAPTEDKKRAKKAKSKDKAKKEKADNEIIGFDFGQEESEENAQTEAADADSAQTVTIDLSEKLTANAESAQPSSDAAEGGESEEQLPAKKSKQKKAKKPAQNEDKDENDTTIIDAVAKDMENEARQTLIQKALTDEAEDDELAEASDEDVTDGEAVIETAETKAQDDEPAITEVAPESEEDKAEFVQSDIDSQTTKEDEKGESDKERYTKPVDIPHTPTGEEEEYRRALALRDKRLTKARSVFDFIELFVFTLVAVLLITTFFVRHSIVDGDSMLGTLEDGQSLLISNFMYEPKCGDIVVVEDHSTILKKPIVKRIIAVGGQTVKVTLHGVYVDGELLDEPYVFTDGLVYQYNVIPCDALLENETLVYGYTYYEFVVPEGELFIMGDHRNMSMDSRDIGTVHADAIIGKVLVRVAPFDDFKIFN